MRRVLAERGFDPAQMGLPDHEVPRITHRFPILIGRSGRLIDEAFGFLFDVAFVRGSTTSIRTLETYAESLLSWLTYAEEQGLQWRKPTALMLAAYRDRLLGTGVGDRRNPRPLSRRTVNLRLTVAIEFYKHLGWIAATSRSKASTLGLAPHDAPCDEAPRPQVRGQDFRRLRVRIYSRRPKALRAAQCHALSQELSDPYRLMWQWALCTGLRTCSLVQIGLKVFGDLRQHSNWAQTINLGAKGGKVVSVHVPAELIAATDRYVSVERALVAGRRGRTAVPSLFLNAHGRPVTGKTYYRALKRAGARTKIPVRPHQARTTFATYVRDKLEAMNDAGSNLDPIKIVQALLAHADARTTEQYLESIDVPSLDVLHVLDELARTAVALQGLASVPMAQAWCSGTPNGDARIVTISPRSRFQQRSRDASRWHSRRSPAAIVRAADSRPGCTCDDSPTI